MYVCVCEAVTEGEVDGAIEAGALSVAEVTRACGAGGDCGACHSAIHSMIASHDESSSHLHVRGADSKVQPERRALALLRSRAA